MNHVPEHRSGELCLRGKLARFDKFQVKKSPPKKVGASLNLVGPGELESPTPTMSR